MNFVAAACGLLLSVSSIAAEERVVNVYNWSDYIAEDTLANFKQATGIKAVYDVYDSNETLEAKLLAGHSGYDVVFPSLQPFAKRHIEAGVYAELDKSALPNLVHVDDGILKEMASADPGNTHLVPYMWGTTGIGYNVAMVKERLGADAPIDSWALIFDPNNAKKLAGCGISLFDDEVEVFAAALLYLGKDASSSDPKDIVAATALLNQARPYIKYFHSSQYINDLANGDLCVAQGYSGDVIQARDRAKEAGNQVEVGYVIPKEGAVLWIDVMAIPKDAPHPQEAHAFINYLLQPEVIAAISDYVSYANANKDATELVAQEVRDDKGVYPSAQTKARLVTVHSVPTKIQRLRVRSWTRIKTGK
jgi:putrescine transport system substrate-binding protein